MAILFGTEARVKLMRLFLMNPQEVISDADAARRARVSPRAARAELAVLAKAKLVTRSQVMQATPPRSKNGKPGKKRVSAARLNLSSPHREPLRVLLAHTGSVEGNEFLRRFRGAGKLKLLIRAGFFIGEDGSRADVLLVGDRLNKSAIERAIRVLESEIGKELSYASFETGDFLYRIGVCDKFVRDILDYPHETVFDRLGGEAQ